MPLPDQPVRTRARVILLAILAQLQASPLFSADAVFLWVGDEELPFQPIGDGYVTLSLRGGIPDNDYQDSGGRGTLLLRRRLTVTVWTRFAVDESTRDFAWLTDLALGHYEREQAVFEALSLFWPMDEVQNALTIEPIRVAAIGDVRKDRTQPGWGHSSTDWEVAFLLDLDQSKQ